MWLFLLYGLVAVLAIRYLLMLMENHRKVHTYQLKQELVRHAEEAAAQAATEKLEAELEAASTKVEPVESAKAG